MSEKANNQNLFTVEGPQSVLARTFFAEYLLFKGYLVSDLDQLPSEVAQSLIIEAYQFTQLRLADMAPNERLPWKTSFTISLN
ncbi:MAG: hypothetical protein ACK2TV_14375 [Anaerolineales bacterium]